MQKSIDIVIPAYNAAAAIGDTVLCVSRQTLPDSWSMTIIVYDDGSTDGTARILKDLRRQVDSLKIVTGDTNGGRSLACNRGIEAGEGDVVLVCDADCRFSRRDTVAGFVAEIESGYDAVIGFVEMSGSGFWARYTNSVMGDRQTEGQRRGLATYSAANCAIRRDVFKALKGFSTEFTHYGFEDKDFLLRLEALGKPVAIRPDLKVRHDDDLTLGAVCRKQFESGRHSAGVFRRRHPDAYLAMPYARCDAALGRMRPLAPVSGQLQGLTRFGAAIMLRIPSGFAVRRFFVRVAMCAAYFHGTRLAAADTRGPER